MLYRYSLRPGRACAVSGAGEMEGPALSKISNGALEMARRGAKKYRAYLKMRDRKARFVRLKAAHGAMAEKATFRDYRDAFEQTGCCVEEYFLFPVSYTHLDVYKRQFQGSRPPQRGHFPRTHPRCRCAGWR